MIVVIDLLFIDNSPLVVDSIDIVPKYIVFKANTRETYKELHG